MAERVYIETTVVSYLTARPHRDVVIAGHQQITHEWWDTRRESYELCARSWFALRPVRVIPKLLRNGLKCCRP